MFMIAKNWSPFRRPPAGGRLTVTNVCDQEHWSPFRRPPAGGRLNGGKCLRSKMRDPLVFIVNIGHRLGGRLLAAS